MTYNYRFVAFLMIIFSGNNLAVGQQSNPTTTALDLSVMTFNIRNGRANDGENGWTFRKDFVCDVIRDSAADIIGLQEAFRFQLDEIRKILPEFNEVGEGRDGGTRGEYSAILYKKKAFKVEESDTFWLSDTPQKKSRNWGNRYLRVCTWVRLTHLTTGHSFYVFNTHFDHQSQNSRLQSSKLIASRIAQRSPKDPFVMVGDFNAGENNPVIEYLKGTGSQGKSPVPVLDTFRKLYPDKKVVGTGNGFTGRQDGNKIDYVFVAPETNVLKAAIIRSARKGRYPSDHFPVTATIVFDYENR
jgi:endonuclease/exonuclease/phosphatase family metal-dependent hydrolase